MPKTGTHITGGFPGLVAREVGPALKCRGCLHFDPQGGKTGVCLIGLQPSTCGDGDYPDTGYAPADQTGPAVDAPDRMANVAQASEAGRQDVAPLYSRIANTQVPIKWDFLGEEQASLVKSMEAEHDRRQEMFCPLHQQHGGNRMAPGNTELVFCKCEDISDITLAKSLAAQLSPAARQILDMEDLKDFVAHTREGQTAHSAAVEGIRKSLYSDDWICQFKGTPLFKQAYDLCEQELKMCEENLVRREEAAKKNKERNAAMAKLSSGSEYDYDEAYRREEKLRLAKQKLQLKLAKHHQSQIEGK